MAEGKKKGPSLSDESAGRFVDDVSFRTVFENAAIGMALSDRRGRALYCNQALAEFMGYSLDELLRLSVARITHPEDITLDWELYQKLWRGEITHYQAEKRYIRGGRADRLGPAQRLHDQGTRFRGQLRPGRGGGTSRKGGRPETDLRASEERFRMVADFTYDWEDWRGPDGRFIYVSPFRRADYRVQPG